jgi:predicted RNA-binding protein with PUA-like domain
MEGRTNSLHVENFELKPKPDWLAGAIEIAKFAAEYYADDEAVKSHFYHPDQSANREEWSLKDAKKAGKLEEYRKEHGYKDGETAYQRLERSFKEFRKSEAEVFSDFLAKFAPEA